MRMMFGNFRVTVMAVRARERADIFPFGNAQ